MAKLLVAAVLVLLVSQVAARPTILEQNEGSPVRSLNCDTSSGVCYPTPPKCNYYKVGADGSGCYFTPGMLSLKGPMAVVTDYYCGDGCPNMKVGHRQWSIKCPAITCGSTFAQVLSQQNGCASAGAFVSSTASGDIESNYQNPLGTYLATAFADFCSNPSAAQLTATAGLAADAIATAYANVMGKASYYVCNCCNGQSYSRSTVQLSAQSHAKAIVSAFSQVLTAVLTTDCGANQTTLAQATATAEAAASQLSDVFLGFADKVATTKGVGSRSGNQICNNPGSWSGAKTAIAQAAACTITAALSSAYNDPSQYATQCSSAYAVAVPTDSGSVLETCKSQCSCQGGLVWKPIANGIYDCECPTGKTWNPASAKCA